MRPKWTGKNIYVQFFKTVATNLQLCKQHRVIIVISLYPASHSGSNISGRSLALAHAPSALCIGHSQPKSQRQHVHCPSKRKRDELASGQHMNLNIPSADFQMTGPSVDVVNTSSIPFDIF